MHPSHNQTEPLPAGGRKNSERGKPREEEIVKLIKEILPRLSGYLLRQR